MLRRIVTAAGASTILMGSWIMVRAHHVAASGCRLTPSNSPMAQSGVNTSCMRVVAAYGEGLLFVAAGVLLIFIAYRVVTRHQRWEQRSALRAVPRHLGATARSTPHVVIRH